MGEGGVWESWAVAALGATVVVVAALHPVVFGVHRPLTQAAEALITGALGGATFVSGVRIARRGAFDPPLRRRIAYWTFGGTAVAMSAAVALVLVRGSVTPHEYVFALQAAAGAGMFGGTVAGYNEARAVVRAREAERARRREKREREVRERLDFLNSLLGHDALNAAAVIEGYADLLGEEAEGSAATYADTIAEQSRTIADLVNDVRVLAESIEDPPELEAVNLGAVVEEEAASVERRHGGATVETAVGDTWVRTDDLLGALFRNLLSNAVEHHDGDRAHVVVRAERTDGRVVVTVADDGPGLPADVRPPFTPQTGNHGHGLYLVQTLVERYRGDIAVTENGPRGTVFEITLDAAAPGKEYPIGG